jgi:poly(3-hydroxybutyrate) depolymerase
MTITRFACVLGLITALVGFPNAGAQTGTAIDAAFQKFWSARSSTEAERSAADVVKTGISFNDALQRLKAGRRYAAEKTGVVKLNNKTKDGIEHNYALNIPASYDPARRYQVRFQLHGGIGGRADNQPRGSGEIGALAGAEQIYVIPYAWNDAPWWSEDQILNFDAILDALKRQYNVDENRVVVAGVSDGGTGAYYIAMHNTTPFASFLPLNGFIMVLANDEFDDGSSFPTNLRNKPIFAVNGGKDPLYPTSIVEPFLNHMMRGGVEIAYHPQPDAAHNTSWWPQVKDSFEQFVAAHPRDPYPDKVTWETTDLAHNRASWVIIDKLGVTGSDAKRMSDVNVVDGSESIPGPGDALFSRKKPSGRIDVVRNGNTIEATTRGVTGFTLLLSYDKLDFAQDVKVVANGRVLFNGRVKPSVETLMKWAARDNDRTMLYAAELNLNVR